MGEYSSFSGMACLLNATMGIEGVLGWGEDRIELRLLDVCSVSIDGFQGGI